MQIGSAMHMYSTDHDDNFPQGTTAADVFIQLIEGGYLSEKVGWPRTPVYVCPGATADVKAWRRAKKPTEETCSYEFLPGVHSHSLSDFVVGFDKSVSNHEYMTLPGAFVSRGRNVLFVDGHVEWNPEEYFEERLEWPREMMKSMEDGGEYVPLEDWREAQAEE